MNLLSWLVLGLIAGAIVKAIAPGVDSGHIISNILVGIAGAIAGGIFATLYVTGHLALMAAHVSLLGISLSAMGAIVAVFVWQVLIRTAV